ncbi:MAG: LapA family protein [Actinomycetota bacterium]|nr:MAG: LapA family protein [Actinomycetota bacterium]
MTEDNGSVDPRGGKPAPTPFGSPPPLDWKRWIKPTLWGLLALFTLLFILTNRETAEVHFVFFTAAMPTVWLLVFTLALGALLSEGARFWLRRRKSRRDGAEGAER